MLLGVPATKLLIWIFLFFAILWHLKIAKMANFAILANLGCHKMAKNPNIKNLNRQIIAGTPRDIYTSFYLDSSIFQRLDAFFVQSRGPQKVRKMKKRKVFWAKIWQFLTKMFKTLKININHLNTLAVQILSDLRHFWLKNCRFCPFLGLIFPIIL